ncbi:MAG: hypothetical protein ACRCYU_02710 [Nocardioides sp.]
MAKVGPARLATFGLLAASLLCALVIGSVSAGAATGPAKTSVAGPLAFKTLPKRNLNDRLVNKPTGAIIKGNVNPGWAGKNVVIQRATCDGCAFEKFAKVRTNSSGGWKYKLSAPATGSWYWKGYVKRTRKYGKSQTNFIYEARLS